MFDWIAALIDRVGPLGVALLMFAENVFPPIPSELIMPLAGFNAAQGRMGLVSVIIAGTIGSVAGATLWYALGRAVGPERVRRLAERHGRWLTITPAEVDRAQVWFDRHGALAVLFGRLVPAVRTLISIPAGLARMPLGPFLLWSTLGSLGWTTLLAVAGWMLEGAYTRVEGWVNPISTAVVIALVAIYIWRVVTWGRRR
ncbi:DedA family protein [Paracoccus suum]|uniref:DedA family protein n=1 Tax=Paracoccus suum TaxID=2259340 RepID=A0A344PM18_9RHOB|nr:DedA family protein [Paracoccus suum]AXC50423.1 DedA family protein [Paracoccus suum]